MELNAVSFAQFGSPSELEQQNSVVTNMLLVVAKSNAKVRQEANKLVDASQTFKTTTNHTIELLKEETIALKEQLVFAEQRLKESNRMHAAEKRALEERNAALNQRVNNLASKVNDRTKTLHQVKDLADQAIKDVAKSDEEIMRSGGSAYHFWKKQADGRQIFGDAISKIQTTLK